jgi:hypothetical protein
MPLISAAWSVSHCTRRSHLGGARATGSVCLDPGHQRGPAGVVEVARCTQFSGLCCVVRSRNLTRIGASAESEERTKIASRASDGPRLGRETPTAHVAGEMLQLTRKKLSGSYWAFTRARRA